jgi:ABC-type multidrug transport system fused ATPase/permease subunit
MTLVEPEKSRLSLLHRCEFSFFFTCYTLLPFAFFILFFPFFYLLLSFLWSLSLALFSLVPVLVLHVRQTTNLSRARTLSLFFPKTHSTDMSTGSVIRSQEQHKVFVASVSESAISVLMAPLAPHGSSPGIPRGSLRCPSFCLGCPQIDIVS